MGEKGGILSEQSPPGAAGSAFGESSVPEVWGSSQADRAEPLSPRAVQDIPRPGTCRGDSRKESLRHRLGAGWGTEPLCDPRCHPRNLRKGGGGQAALWAETGVVGAWVQSQRSVLLADHV